MKRAIIAAALALGATLALAPGAQAVTGTVNNDTVRGVLKALDIIPCDESSNVATAKAAEGNKALEIKLCEPQ